MPLLSRIRNKYRRTCSRWLFKRPLSFVSDVPLISFTFDDFPRSALLVGGEILRRHGLAGTYYCSLGLMGKEAPTGTMFSREDLENALHLGHELGCHTYDHLDASETPSLIFKDSVYKNRKAFEQLFPGNSLRTLSYPLAEPRGLTKYKISETFLCCRGGGQCFNIGTLDMNCLRGFFLEQARHSPASIHEIIERNRRSNGWLIFATHDISDQPTPWGCTLKLFEEVVLSAVESGAKILPVARVGEYLAKAAR